MLMTKDTITNFAMLKNESCDDSFLQEDINWSFNLFLNTLYISFELRFPMQHVTTELKNNCWLAKGISCEWKKSLYIVNTNRNYRIIKAYIECCVVLCCVVCCVVLCCVVLRCVVLRSVALCCVVLCCAVLCCVVLCCVVLCWEKLLETLKNHIITIS
jgi:hypothetical protein